MGKKTPPEQASAGDQYISPTTIPVAFGFNPVGQARQDYAGRTGGEKVRQAHRDADYLRLFPGDLERARRLGSAYTLIQRDFLSRLPALQLNDYEAAQVLEAALSVVSPKLTGPVDPISTIPTEAPELWAQRDLNRRENAPQFVRRVYATWLGHGLQRRHLKALDADLYKALSVWLSRHPDDPIVGQLPSQSDMMDDLIEQLSTQYPVELLRRIGHAIDARKRRDEGADKSA